MRTASDWTKGRGPGFEREAQLVAVAASGAALLVGLLLAYKVQLGVGALIAIAYTTVAVLSLPLGIVMWIPLLFVPYLAGPNALFKLGFILICLAWLGTLRLRRMEVAAALRRHGRLLLATALLFLWLALSVAWADDIPNALRLLYGWGLSLAMFLVLCTTISTRRHAMLVAGAFVAGALISTLLGLVGSVDTSPTSASGAALREGRLQGGVGDPNVLASALVPAIVLAGCLLAEARVAVLRAGLIAAMGATAVGLAASESRGGLVAAGVAMLLAIAVFKRQRIVALTLVLFTLGLGMGFLAATPDALDRVEHFDGGGTGRNELWQLAWEIGVQHPATGVGLSNFIVETPKVVRRPGQLKYVELVTSREVGVAHNTYLQLFADTGLPGIVLFLVVVALSLAAALSAARQFEQAGVYGPATLARGGIVATVGMLAAAVFLSMGEYWLLWIVLALGPILRNVAARELSPSSDGPDGPAATR